jgi:tetratricopeptide (TPR) repeat protein
MAYALKTEDVTVTRWANSKTDEPYYGYDQNLIPYKAMAAGTADAEARAREHLKQSIAHYEAALGIDPQHPLARLGYGWMLEQAGEKARAIVEYRRVISDAWKKDVRNPVLHAASVSSRQKPPDTSSRYWILRAMPRRSQTFARNWKCSLKSRAPSPRWRSLLLTTSRQKL